MSVRAEWVLNLFGFFCNNFFFSDGYDLAQEAMCFLCGYMGKDINDAYGKSVRGKTVTIKAACYSRINQMVMRERKDSFVLANNDSPEVINLSTPFEINAEENYGKVAETVSRMHLTKSQNETLDYLIGGMPLMHVAELYNVMVSTICFVEKRFFGLQKIFGICLTFAPILHIISVRKLEIHTYKECQLC